MVKNRVTNQILVNLAEGLADLQMQLDASNRARAQLARQINQLASKVNRADWQAFNDRFDTGA